MDDGWGTMDGGRWTVDGGGGGRGEAGLGGCAARCLHGSWLRDMIAVSILEIRKAASARPLASASSTADGRDDAFSASSCGAEAALSTALRLC